MLHGGNLHYEMGERIGRWALGAWGSSIPWCNGSAWCRRSDDHLHLLKVHLPYHESDHVLNFGL